MREQIKLWLRRTGRDRHWLAAQCGVTKRTVDNWLSANQPMATSVERLIQTLMEADAAVMEEKKADQTLLQNLVLSVPESTFEAYNDAALHHGMRIKDWAIHELDRAAMEAKAAAMQTRATALVAEEGTGTYGDSKRHAASPAQHAPQDAPE